MTESPFDLDITSRIREIRPHRLIALWLQSEKAGNVSHEMSARAANGAFTGVTLGDPGIGDWYGYSTPFYDGANDFNNVWSPAFRDAFNGAEGTVLIPVRMATGAWVDGIERYPVRLFSSIFNQVYLMKRGIFNSFYWNYVAGGVGVSVISPILGGRADWIPIGITWSASKDEMRAFADGIQVGATQNGLGLWAGNLLNVGTVIGAASTVPANVHHGRLGPCAVWTEALSQPEIQYLSIRRP